MRTITPPARLAGPRWWRLARVRGGAAPRGRPDDGWIDDANRVARGQLANYLSTYLPIYLPICQARAESVARTCGEHTVSYDGFNTASASNLGGGDDGK
eukprot:scaffold49834_cov93-Phaeocystis_antarctica.AAC.1